MNIKFKKYQGTGNDFVIIDNRQNKIKLTKSQIAAICNRRFGIGADGLMLLEKEKGYDFKMVYYNADGGESTMCGNGGRCLVQFAYDIGIKKDQYKFLAVDGAHDASIDNNKNWVALKMIDVSNVMHNGADKILDTGSPHYIQHQPELAKFNVFEKGKKIRYSAKYANSGININFVQELQKNKLFVRTYERGVEDETFSCGTGVTAAAIAYSGVKKGNYKINIQTIGGNLQVNYYKKDEQNYTDVWLLGPAKFVYEGSIKI